MFGFFAPAEAVTVVEVQDGTLTFLSKKSRSVGKTCKVRLANNLDVALSLVHVRPAPDQRGYVCVAKLDEALQSRLGTPQPPAPDLGLLARRSPRFSVSLRSRSRELPGFSAITMDLSQLGARLVVRGEVPVGSQVNLTMELDVGSMEPLLTLTARTVWCRPGSRTGEFLVGVEFAKDQPASLQLQRYLKSVAFRLSGDVQHRSVIDGETICRPQEKASA